MTEYPRISLTISWPGWLLLPVLLIDLFLMGGLLFVLIGCDVPRDWWTKGKWLRFSWRDRDRVELKDLEEVIQDPSEPHKLTFVWRAFGFVCERTVWVRLYGKLLADIMRVQPELKSCVRGLRRAR